MEVRSPKLCQHLPETRGESSYLSQPLSILEESKSRRTVPGHRLSNASGVISMNPGRGGHSAKGRFPVEWARAARDLDTDRWRRVGLGMPKTERGVLGRREVRSG